MRDAREAGFPQLELGDADHVLDAHAHRKVAGELGDERAVGAGQADEPVDARKVAAGVGAVLVVSEALDAFGQDCVRFGRKGSQLGFGGQTPRFDAGDLSRHLMRGV